ncbi:MAG TPA: cytochrome c peroxidase [Candidatus Kapabacteria bacterium]|nr:cytochrome c peroxidase [Candidatus Kapabacteria bacterium]
MNHKTSILRLPALAALITATLSLSACNKDLASDPTVISSAQQSEDIQSPIPTSPGAMVIPASNTMSASKVELGRMLFFDPNISIRSKDASVISCASCHLSTKAFSDNRSVSPGIDGKLGTRNAPTLINVAYNTAYTWDGKFKSLEEHAPGPMFSPVEMGNNFSNDPRDTSHSGYQSDPGQNDTLLLFKRLMDANSTQYTVLLTNAYGEAKFSLDRIVKALACFERTIVSNGSPFDSYNQYLHNQGGNKNAINESAKRGFKIFIDANGANCVSCHSGYNFTDGGFHNNGLDHSLAKPMDDIGYGAVTKLSSDKYKYKVPTLRNVAITGPYMHDGRFTTLDEVVTQYNNGGSHSLNQDPRIHALNLSAQDKADLIAFLQSLTDGQATAASNQMLAPPLDASRTR